MDMKSDFTQCRKILYFDKIHMLLRNLLFIGLFVSIIGLVYTNIYEYKYFLLAFAIGLAINFMWKGFFISEEDAFLTEKEIKKVKNRSKKY